MENFEASVATEMNTEAAKEEKEEKKKGDDELMTEASTPVAELLKIKVMLK